MGFARSFVRRRRRVEFDESLKLTDAAAATSSTPADVSPYIAPASPAIVSLILRCVVYSPRHTKDNSAGLFLQKRRPSDH